jgi:hypothetical protein
VLMKRRCWAGCSVHEGGYLGLSLFSCKDRHGILIISRQST